MEVDLVKVGEDSAIVKTFPRKQKHQRMGSLPKSICRPKEKNNTGKVFKDQQGVSNMMLCIWSFTHENTELPNIKSGNKDCLSIPFIP